MTVIILTLARTYAQQHLAHQRPMSLTKAIECAALDAGCDKHTLHSNPEYIKVIEACLNVRRKANRSRRQEELTALDVIDRALEALTNDNNHLARC